MTEPPHKETATDLVLRAKPPADRHPLAVFIGGLAPGSRRTMRESLHIIARYLTNGQADAESLDWSRVRYQHAAAIRSFLADKYAASTANKMLSALRGVLKETWRLEYVSAEEYHRAVDLPTVRGESAVKGRSLSRGELTALFRICAIDPSPAGARDAALLAVAVGGGLRRAELTALDLSDFDPQTGALTVMGKGKKVRTVYTSNGSDDALRAWLKIRGSKPGPIFVSVGKSGTIKLHKRLTEDGIYKAFHRRAREARVEPFNPHSLRHTYISDLLDLGADLSTVRQLAGHSNVNTTAKYDRRGEDAKRRAAEMLSVPYTPPERKGRK